MLDREVYVSHPWTVEFQNKLSDLKIAIVGDGLIIDYLATSLVALGAGINDKGYVNIYTNSNDGFLNRLEGNRIDTLNAISPRPGSNPESDSDEENTKKRKFSQKKLSYIIENPKEHHIVGGKRKPDILIAAINREDKDGTGYLKNLFECCKEQEVNFLSLEVNSYKGVMHNPINLASKSQMEFLLDSHGAQNPSVCGVITGVTLESILRIVANRPDTLREKNIYNLKSRYLDGLVDDQDIELQDCSNSHVLLVGAGAMGNFVAINLALSGIKELTVLDYDYIAKKNLNRQVLYYGRELKQKVDVLEERLRKINPSLKVNAINFQVCIEKEKEFKNILKEKEIDVIVGCVDQIRPRLFLTYFINKNYEKLKVPYIDGACEVRMSKEMIPIGSASVFVHIPGKSSCMVCNNRDMPVMIQENVPEEREASCTAAQETQDERPNFSVISSNMTAASFITGELGRVINNSKDVHAHMSLTTQEPRGWINGFNTEPCNCKGIKPKYFKKLKLDPEHRSKYGR